MYDVCRQFVTSYLNNDLIQIYFGDDIIVNHDQANEMVMIFIVL